MTVADAVRCDGFLDVVGQAANEPAFRVLGSVEVGKRALLARQSDGGAIGGMADDAHGIGSHRQRRIVAVAQVQHDQRIRQVMPSPMRRLPWALSAC
jgi:spore maturation protein SpmB